MEGLKEFLEEGVGDCITFDLMGRVGYNILQNKGWGCSGLDPAGKWKHTAQEVSVFHLENFYWYNCCKPANKHNKPRSTVSGTEMY